MSTETNTSIATQTVDDFLCTTLNKCRTIINHMQILLCMKDITTIDVAYLKKLFNGEAYAQRKFVDSSSIEFRYADSKVLGGYLCMNTEMK